MPRRAIEHHVKPKLVDERALDNLKGKVDFAIITIREDENRAILRRFPKEDIYNGRNRSYSISRLPLAKGGHYVVAVVRSIEQGEGHAQDVTRDIIDDLAPQWLLLVGIAGGVPAAEFTLGDVVVAMRFTDFSVKAAIEGSNSQYAVGGGPIHKKIQNHLALLPAMTDELKGWNSRRSIGTVKPPVKLNTENFYGDAQWRKRVKESLTRHFGRAASPRPPLVTAGSIATSDTLVKDSETLKQWQEAARQVIAVEMELGGVYIAARRPDHEYPILAIRGVSDIVGFKRHPDWTEYACNSAAAFTQAILKTKPIIPKIDLTNRPVTVDCIEDGKEISSYRTTASATSIFRKRGSLAIKDPSYIERDCDSLLKRNIANAALIAISGDYQMGKSSLLNQVGDYLPQDWKSCYLDLSGTRTDDLHLLTSKFFRVISQQFGGVESWDEVATLSSSQSLVFLLDEFGSLGIDRKIAQGFVPKLIDLTNSQNVTIIVCLPNGVEQFIKEQNIFNPKYCDSWLTIHVKPFTIEQTKQLLSLLPSQVSRIVMPYVNNIHQRVGGQPRPLQCLCSHLFDGYLKRASEKALVELLYKDSCYQ